MKKQTIKLLVGFIISGAVLISAGCPGNTPQNKATNSNQTNANNTNSGNNQSTNTNSNNSENDNQSPEDKKVVADFIEKMKNDPDLKDQIGGIEIWHKGNITVVSGSISGKKSLFKLDKLLSDTFPLVVFRNFRWDLNIVAGRCGGGCLCNGICGQCGPDCNPILPPNFELPGGIKLPPTYNPNLPGRVEQPPNR